MNIILLLAIVLIFGSCKDKSGEIPIKSVLDSNFDDRRFPYDPEKNPLMFMDVLIQGKHPTTFVVDNGLSKEDKIVFNREFARKNL